MWGVSIQESKYPHDCLIFLLTCVSVGAKEAGAAGFFKGLGKGVVGVLARPAGGLVDFASSTLEGIKGSVQSLVY